jgi:MOSC domain-containing protein YiiM
MSGRIEALWLKPEEYGPMAPVDALEVEAGTGIRGNADRGGRRQVTIIERERWDAMMRELGDPGVDPSARRANVLVTGCDLGETRGRVLRLGDVRIRIEGETRPCERMDAAHPGLRRAMAAPWNGGAFGVVLDPGTIRVGDTAELLEPAAEPDPAALME